MRGAVSPAAFVEHAAVIYAQGGGGEVWSFRQGAAEVSVTVSGPLRVSAAEGVRAGVLADMGLAITSAWMFSPELASGAVRPVLTDWSCRRWTCGWFIPLGACRPPRHGPLRRLWGRCCGRGLPGHGRHLRER